MATKKQPSTKRITVKNLARVEGEGGLYVRLKNREVKEVQLKIFEPPRFFEAFLQGREYSEVPDITARICGICPIAYQMSASQALENAIGVDIPNPIRALRRLIYCGEWIQSHVLHVFMLHAPDFLGYQGSIQMAKDHPQIVKDALQLKKIGNEIMEVVGGRAVHPVNLRVGGFYRFPEIASLNRLREKLAWGQEKMVEMLHLVKTFHFPDFERPYEFVALHHPQQYAITEGRLVSSGGLNIPINEYEAHFREIHVAHSNALHSVLNDQPYFVGPLARYNLNFDQLSPAVREIAGEIGCLPPCHNPFKSIIVRSLETLYAFEEALRLIDVLQKPSPPAAEVKPVAGTGYGCSEAPRGICWHKYTVDAAGLIQQAKIVPPTSQNQPTIEADIEAYVEKYQDLEQEDLTWQCEQAIRNYDPCISCATHFLTIDIQRD